MEHQQNDVSNDSKNMKCYDIDKFEALQMQKNPCAEDFDTLKVLGKGSYAKVLLVRRKTDGKIFAMKVMKKKHIQQKKQVEHIMAERNIMVGINHPFITRLICTFQTEDRLYLVLEYCPGGELFGLLKRRKKLSEQQVKFYAAQIVLALEYIHSKDIIYRDLKPENVLIDEHGYIRLTDFGLAKQKCEANQSYSICGTPQYLAPEILYKEGHGKPVDWWCLGCLIFELLTGLPPFYCENRNSQFDKIKFSEPNLPAGISQKLKCFLEGLFDKRQHFRLGYEGATDLKKHPWFEKIAWDELIKKNIKPPFVPNLKNQEDVSYFDSEYTELDVDSEGETHSPTSCPFKDFSFDKQNQNKHNNREEEETCEFELKMVIEESSSENNPTIL